MATAAPSFAYRDPGTGCDLLVARPDRIPRPHRENARVVTQQGARAVQAASEACLHGATDRLGAGGATGGVAAPRAIDVRLARNGGRYLTTSELEDLARLRNPRVSAYILAALAALVAWISVMVAAFREDHLGWAMLMLFLSVPMAFVYLFTTLGKGHGRFKVVCALGMVSPLLVFLANLWWVFGAATG